MSHFHALAFALRIMSVFTDSQLAAWVTLTMLLKTPTCYLSKVWEHGVILVIIKKAKKKEKDFFKHFKLVSSGSKTKKACS